MQALLLELAQITSEKIEDLEVKFQSSLESGLSLNKNIENLCSNQPEVLVHVYSKLFGYQIATDLQAYHPEPDYLLKFSLEYSQKNTCMVFRKETHLYFATAHVLESHVFDEVSYALNQKITPLLILARQLDPIFEKAYNLIDEQENSGDLDYADIEKLSQSLDKNDDLLDMANKAPVVKLINSFLAQALKLRASDIHIHPYEQKVVIRFRVDGLLQEALSLPKKVQDAVITRIKVMGKMDVAEKRLPQDGGTNFISGGREVDVRISSLPSVNGERMVLRLQDKTSNIHHLSNIGLLDNDVQKIQELLKMSHGMILVTGPTGSGKTTTLYSMLDQLNTPQRNIITLEDPVELILPGVSQIQIAPKKGLTFASGLRSIVRQDPDVIMVGEIRDLETARTSIQSALTGHLVFSTLHTNDSVSTLTRLIDLGVEPHLINASVLSIIAQRLVRRICPHCIQNQSVSSEELEAMHFCLDEFNGFQLKQGKGCEHCMHTGYIGRVGIYEILFLQGDVKQAISQGASLMDIQKIAEENGLRTLRSDGITKIKEGLTTLEEVFRVTQSSSF